MPIESLDLTAAGGQIYGAGAGPNALGDGSDCEPSYVFATANQGELFPPNGCRATTTLYSYWIDGWMHQGYLYLVYGGGGGAGNRIYRYTLSVVGGKLVGASDTSVLVSDILTGANNWAVEGCVQYDGTNVILVGVNTTVGTGRTPVIGKWAMSDWPFTAGNALWLSPVKMSAGSYVAGEITHDGSSISSPLIYLSPNWLYVISSRLGQVHVINPNTGAVEGAWPYYTTYLTTEYVQFQLWGEVGGKVYGGNALPACSSGNLARFDITNPSAWVNEGTVFDAAYSTYPNPVSAVRRASRGLDGRYISVRPISRHQLDIIGLPSTTMMWWENDCYGYYGDAVLGFYDTASGEHYYRALPQDPNRRAIGNSLALFYPCGFLRDFMIDQDGVSWFVNMAESNLDQETESPGLFSPYQRGMVATPIGPISINYPVPARNATPKVFRLTLPPAAVDVAQAVDHTKYRVRVSVNGGAPTDWRSGPKQCDHLDEEVDGLTAWPSWLVTDSVEVDVELCAGWPYRWGGIIRGNPTGPGDPVTPIIGGASPGLPQNAHAILEVATTEAAALAAVVSPNVTLQEGTTETLAVVLTRETAGAITVNLNSSDPTKATVPASVIVPDGDQYANFTLTGVAFGSTVITASYLGVDKTSNVTVDPVEIAAVAPDELEALVLSTTTAQVTFEAPVVRDEVVALSSDPGVTVPASVTVLTGNQSASFNVVTNSLGPATITATHSTGVKTCDIVVVARGYGPCGGHTPTVLSSERLVPTIISSEKL